MSSVGDAARDILAAADGSDGVRSSLAAVRVEVEVAHSLLLAASEGSRREEPQRALSGLAAARIALEQAETMLDAAGDALRRYVAEVLVVGGGAHPSLSGGAPAEASGGGLPRLLQADRVVVPMPKFTRFSMDPSGANRGKWKAWPKLGYDVSEESSRRDAAADVMEQLRRHLPSAVPFGWRDHPYGEACRTRTPVTGPNGRRGTLVVAWLFPNDGSDPKMMTNWVEVHREQ